MVDEKAFCHKYGAEILANDEYCSKFDAQQFELPPKKENKTEVKQEKKMVSKN